MYTILLLAAAVAVSFGQEPTGVVQELGAARVLASKFFLSQYAVEDKDYVVDYHLHNIGDKAALKVTLDDRHSFPTQTFEIVRGLLQVRWERLGPGANVTHSVVLRPRQFGAFNYTAGQITYYPSEDAKEVRVGYTTAPGEGYIYRLKDYERKFSPHVGDWAIFALMALPCVGLPLLLWFKTKSKYDIDLKKSK
uniref:Translocon-associated protein subunit beta n=1 Tax=Plectus sambesii TaxID=2011161 RepID=A0A914WM16_9BILA